MGLKTMPPGVVSSGVCVTLCNPGDTAVQLAGAARGCGKSWGAIARPHTTGGGGGVVLRGGVKKGG